MKRGKERERTDTDRGREIKSERLQREKEEETRVCLKTLSGKYLAPKLISLFDQKRGVEN